MGHNCGAGATRCEHNFGAGATPCELSSGGASCISRAGYSADHLGLAVHLRVWVPPEDSARGCLQVRSVRPIGSSWAAAISSGSGSAWCPRSCEAAAEQLFQYRQASTAAIDLPSIKTGRRNHDAITMAHTNLDMLDFHFDISINGAAVSPHRLCKALSSLHVACTATESRCKIVTSTYPNSAASGGSSGSRTPATPATKVRSFTAVPQLLLCAPDAVDLGLGEPGLGWLCPESVERATRELGSAVGASQDWIGQLLKNGSLCPSTTRRSTPSEKRAKRGPRDGPNRPRASAPLTCKAIDGPQIRQR